MLSIFWHNTDNRQSNKQISMLICVALTSLCGWNIVNKSCTYVFVMYSTIRKLLQLAILTHTDIRFTKSLYLSLIELFEP